MAKFERNPSGSFPEKTKNKLPDFPLLIYRYFDTELESAYCSVLLVTVYMPNQVLLLLKYVITEEIQNITSFMPLQIAKCCHQSQMWSIPGEHLLLCLHRDTWCSHHWRFHCWEWTPCHQGLPGYIMRTYRNARWGTCLLTYITEFSYTCNMSYILEYTILYYCFKITDGSIDANKYQTF